MMRGDLILYRSSGRWYERFITMATHGPYTHVAIVVDSFTVIAARTQGIAYEKAPPDDHMHAIIPISARKLTITGTDAHGETVSNVVPMPARTTLAGIEQGLEWATQQVGRQYGWSDVLYQAMKFLCPNNKLRFGVEGHYDCADFACRYLLHAGVQMPDSYLDTYTVTPCDLARLFGLIPPRKAA